MDRLDANNEKQVFNIKNVEFFNLCSKFVRSTRRIFTFWQPRMQRLAMHRFLFVDSVHLWASNRRSTLRTQSYWKVFSYNILRGHRQQQPAAEAYTIVVVVVSGHIQFVSSLLFSLSFSRFLVLWILNCAREFLLNIVWFDRVIDDDGRQRTFCNTTFTTSRVETRDGRCEWAITKSNGIYLKRRHGTTHRNSNAICPYVCVCEQTRRCSQLSGCVERRSLCRVASNTG